MNPLLTVEEAAKLLNCTEAAVRRWLNQRRLTPVKIGRLTRLKLEDIEAVAAKGLPESGQAGQPVRRDPRRPQEPRSPDTRLTDSQSAPEPAQTALA